uniref:Uncharacterized protein n=1 Tax=Pseudonaja textilis TaxID=8673 RepID=A0A670Z630_PSETE
SEGTKEHLPPTPERSSALLPKESKFPFLPLLLPAAVAPRPLSSLCVSQSPSSGWCFRLRACPSKHQLQWNQNPSHYRKPQLQNYQRSHKDFKKT